MIKDPPMAPKEKPSPHHHLREKAQCIQLVLSTRIVCPGKERDLVSCSPPCPEPMRGRWSTMDTQSTFRERKEGGGGGGRLKQRRAHERLWAPGLQEST